MNVHVSYRLPKNPVVEKDVQHQIEKLQKRLQVFRPELVHLKGMVEEVSAREGTAVSLNLRLPSGQMAVQKTASTATAAVRAAFEDLLQQLNKHKEILRASHKWQRDRRGNVTVMMAFLLPPLIGTFGLGFEVANWYLITRSMQNAADSAAVTMDAANPAR